MDAAALSEYDFVLAVDASGSMGDAVGGGNTTSRWDFIRESLIGFARDIGKIDDDGFDLITFGGTNIAVTKNTDAEKVVAVFSDRQPRGSTPLAEALQQAVNIANGSKKKVFVTIFTDGVPDDKDAAAKVLVTAANSLNDETKDRLRFLFVQVGHDPAATAYLQKLDSSLPGAKYDIVNVKTAEQANAFATTTELVTAAILDQH